MNNLTWASCRVSSKKQNDAGWSNEDQREKALRYIEEKELTAWQITEIAESASKSNLRIQFSANFAAAKKANVTDIVFVKIDRSTRNFQTFIELDAWRQEDNHRIHYIEEYLVLDKNSSAHDLKRWGDSVVGAKYYIDNLRQEVVKGMDRKAALGHYPGNRMPGYKIILDGKRKVWEVDPKESEQVQKIFDLYLDEDFSIDRIPAEMLKYGYSTKGKKVAKNTIWKILQNPFYIGKFMWNGVMYDGLHTPLIDIDTFNRVQAKLKGNSGSFIKHSYTYGHGFITCANCNRSLIGEFQNQQVYYACKSASCKGTRYLREDLLEAEIIGYLANFKVFTKTRTEWISKALKAYRGKEADFREVTLEGLQDQLKEQRQRKDRIFESFVDGVTEDETYVKGKMKEVDDEILNTEAAIANYKKTDVSSIDLAIKFIEIARNSAEKYKTFDDKVKRQFLELLTSKRIKDSTNHINLTFSQPWSNLYDASQQILVSQEGLEPSTDCLRGNCSAN